AFACVRCPLQAVSAALSHARARDRAGFFSLNLVVRVQTVPFGPLNFAFQYGDSLPDAPVLRCTLATFLNFSLSVLFSESTRRPYEQQAGRLVPKVLRGSIWCNRKHTKSFGVLYFFAVYVSFVNGNPDRTVTR